MLRMEASDKVRVNVIQELVLATLLSIMDEKDLNYISVIPIVFLSSLRFYYAC